MCPLSRFSKDHLAWLLADQEKVPISRHEFKHQIQNYHPLYPDQEVTADHLNQIFWVSETEFTLYQFMPIERIILGTSFNDDSTKSSFVGLWDDNIWQILERVVDSVAICNSHHHISTALKWPDFGFLIDGKNCLFCGEEKAPALLGNPEELLLKLIWTYDPLLYIPGEYTGPPFVQASHFRIQPIMWLVPGSTSLWSQSLLSLCHSLTTTSNTLKIELPALYVCFICAESSGGQPNGFTMVSRNEDSDACGIISD